MMISEETKSFFRVPYTNMKKTVISIGIVGVIALAAWLALQPRFRVLRRAFFPGVAITNEVRGIGIPLDQIGQYGLTESNVIASVGRPETDGQFLYITPNGQLDEIVVPVGGYVCFAVIEKSDEKGTGVALVEGPRRPIKATLKP